MKVLRLSQVTLIVVGGLAGVAAVVLLKYRGFTFRSFLTFWNPGEWILFGACILIGVVSLLVIDRRRKK